MVLHKPVSVNKVPEFKKIRFLANNAIADEKER